MRAEEVEYGCARPIPVIPVKPGIFPIFPITAPSAREIGSANQALAAKFP
jgi:hypothetical protein